MAIGDRLVIADKPTLDEIKAQVGETTDVGGLNTGSISGKLNEDLKMSEDLHKDVKTLMTLLSSGQFEKDVAGTYTLKLPETVDAIYVTACGAGGGGGGGGTNDTGTYSAGGGGGGEAVENKRFAVSKGATLNITVGKGGTAGTEYASQLATKGGATIISGVVTLSGGGGGPRMSENGGTRPVNGGAAGGAGGGAGGKSNSDGNPGISGIGGKGYSEGTVTGPIAGGGGSIGIGGSAYGPTYDKYKKTEPTRGGGGYGASYRVGQNGADGYVYIVW